MNYKCISFNFGQMIYNKKKCFENLFQLFLIFFQGINDLIFLIILYINKLIQIGMLFFVLLSKNVNNYEHVNEWKGEQNIEAKQ